MRPDVPAFIMIGIARLRLGAPARKAGRIPPIGGTIDQRRLVMLRKRIVAKLLNSSSPSFTQKPQSAATMFYSVKTGVSPLSRSMSITKASPRLLLCLPLALSCACGPDYSPDTYSGNAVQQANKVEQGIVVGVRAVMISADAGLSSATGAAAGGIAGAQVAGGAVGALSALGGSVAGGVAGNVVGHAAGDADGFEYIVRKPGGDMLSVTQKDASPLGIGAHVLIIEGPQARIVPDYTAPIEVQPLHPAAEPATQPKAEPPAAAPTGKAPDATNAAAPADTPAEPPKGGPAGV
jgi:outer membrane lipoprotein SlyB